MSDTGIALMGIGLLGAPVTMILHIVGVVLSWWPATGITWIIPLVFIGLMQLGGALADE